MSDKAIPTLPTTSLRGANKVSDAAISILRHHKHTHHVIARSTATKQSRLCASVPLCLCTFVPLILITGCTLGPNYTRPLNPTDSAASYLNASTNEQKDVESLIDHPWWQNFDDPITNQLVEQALAHNTDIKAAAATVAQAHALLTQTTGRRLPELDLFYNADRSKISFNAPFGRTGFTSTTHAGGFSIRYITDLFGLLRRTEEADTANLLAAEENLLALQHTTIALVVKSRIRIGAL
ncbi:MAG: TolC family protein, partial [Planctomycetes bacterium]|nr:TolC family protein [Planctomycetota bacterium]